MTSITPMRELVFYFLLSMLRIYTICPKEYISSYFKFRKPISSLCLHGIKLYPLGGIKRGKLVGKKEH